MTLKIAVLGSTGSIGRQALEVIQSHPDRFSVAGLAAGSNLSVLAGQVKRHRPRVVSVKEGLGTRLRSLVGSTTAILEGEEGLRHIASMEGVDTVLVAIVGAGAIFPVLSAIESGKVIALANKECLVAAGHIIMDLATRKRVSLRPVDSEHSAIFQCLQGQDEAGLHRLTLTASGGAFRDRDIRELERITPEDALKHPTWRMGKKITVDSATLMNKGFEVIEARWLFGMPPGGIRVLIHPQSIVHSMAEFRDGSTLAHLGPPDMRIPLRYALGYPQRLPGCEPVDLATVGSLEFREPDIERYPCLALAYQALEAGGTLPAVMNAADEVAVEAFLETRVRFLDIQRIIGEVMEKHRMVRDPSLEETLAADAWARNLARRLVKTLGGDR